MIPPFYLGTSPRKLSLTCEAIESLLEVSDFFQLSQFGASKLRSFNVDSAAALFRTAARTVTCWTAWMEQMKVAAEEHLGANFAVAGVFYPSCWHSPPFAHFMRVLVPRSDRESLLTTVGSCLHLEVNFSHEPGHCKKW